MGDPYARHRPVWRELELLVAAAGASAHQLTFAQTERLGVTYRLVTAHLARYRQEGRDPEIVAYLNDLAIRAHGVLYRPIRDRIDPVGFFRRRFPATFRATFRYQLAVCLLTLAAAAVSFAAVQADRELAYTLVPVAFYDRSELHAVVLDPHAQQALLTAGQEGSFVDKLWFSSWLMKNNAQVGLLAFVGGVLAGVPTVLLVIYNGLTLGAFASVFFGAGSFHPLFWPWLLAHGVTELLAINIAAAGGLYVGMGVLDPERLPRIDAIRLRARVALRLGLGTLPMFVIAGLIEGILRQSQLPPWARLLFAAATALAWIAYFGLAGRKHES